MPRQAAGKSASKKPSAKKASTKTAAAAKTTPRKASPRKRASGSEVSPRTLINPDQRRKMIEVAAYYLAEKRGFNGGDPQHDWFLAESEVDRLLESNQIRVT